MFRTVQNTPLIDVHRELGGRLVEFAGFQLPVQYRGVTVEHKAVREAAGLFDVSHMGELFFEGPKAAAALDSLLTNDVAGLRVGRACYTLCCRPDGGILDDLIVYRFAEKRFLIVCNAANRAKLVTYFRRQLEAQGNADECEFTDESDEYALIALQGPRATAVMAAATGNRGLAGLASFSLAHVSVEDLVVTAARTGYTGEDGFELLCPAQHAPALWRILVKAGRAHGLEPAGLGARDTLRLEARLCLYGQDIDETTNPLEAGLGWAVKLGKGEFVGRTALAAAKDAGLQRKLVGFQMRGRGIARASYPIVDDAGERVGRVTSGAPGLTVGHNIGLGYVPRPLGKRGQQLGIEIRGKVVPAEVVRTPFYKRDKSDNPTQ